MPAITRRTLLLGGLVGTMGAGAAILEAGAARRDRLLHRIGIEHGPDRSVAASGVTLEDGALTSSHVPTPPRWTIARPPASAGPVAGIVYCLHGRGGTCRDAFDRIHLHDEVAAAHAPLVLVGVDGGDHSYWHARKDGSDAMAMLTTELMPMIAGRFGALPTAAIGWSMGGYGALLLAESRLPGFRAVAAASPALWTSPGQTPAGAFDDADDFRRHDVFAARDRLAGLDVDVRCGTGDPFYGAAKHFATGLAPQHHATFSAGFHDDAYWRSIAPAQVRFLADALTRPTS